MVALCLAQAMTDGSFSMATIFDHREDRANAIAFPPAPAKISITTVLERSLLVDRSVATLLWQN